MKANVPGSLVSGLISLVVSMNAGAVGALMDFSNYEHFYITTNCAPSDFIFQGAKDISTSKVSGTTYNFSGQCSARAHWQDKTEAEAWHHGTPFHINMKVVGTYFPEDKTALEMISSEEFVLHASKNEIPGGDTEGLWNAGSFTGTTSLKCHSNPWWTGETCTSVGKVYSPPSYVSLGESGKQLPLSRHLNKLAVVVLKTEPVPAFPGAQLSDSAKKIIQALSDARGFVVNNTLFIKPQDNHLFVTPRAKLTVKVPAGYRLNGGALKTALNPAKDAQATLGPTSMQQVDAGGNLWEITIETAQFDQVLDSYKKAAGISVVDKPLYRVSVRVDDEGTKAKITDVESKIYIAERLNLHRPETGGPASKGPRKIKLSYAPDPLLVNQKVAVTVTVTNVSTDDLPGAKATVTCEPLSGVACPYSGKTVSIGSLKSQKSDTAKFTSDNKVVQGKFRFKASIPNPDGSLAETQVDATAGTGGGGGAMKPAAPPVGDTSVVRPSPVRPLMRVPADSHRDSTERTR